MGEPALKIEEVHEFAPARRFELADLSRHGPWLLKRFAQLLPDIPEQRVAGYLRGMLYDNEHLFLYQDHAVALAQLIHSPGLKPVKVVQEKFVFVEDKNDKAQCEDAADMYEHMKQWAKRLDAERIIVCENTDVPKAMIEARLGRIFDTKVSHARI
jgi:hypothetical protein